MPSQFTYSQISKSLAAHRTAVAMANPPVVGMGVTATIYSDAHVFTIVRVSPSGKTFWATEDTAKRVDKNGMSDQQDYVYSSNPEGKQVVFRLLKSGRWEAKGFRRNVTLGVRRAFYDYTR